MDDQAVRLNRIENKLDKLTEAMTMVSRDYEKLTAGCARSGLLEYRLDEYEGDLDSIKQIVGYNAQSVKIAERFVWILISAIIGLATYYVR